MSLTIVSTVVFGFECDVRNKTVDVTKYNESTGVPYTAKKHSHCELLIEGKLIATAEHKFYNSETYAGMDFFDLEDGRYVLGKCMAKVRFETLMEKFPVLETDVQFFRTAYGIKKSPELFLILQVS